MEIKEIKELKKFYNKILYQSQALTTLENDIKTNSVSHSYFLKCSDKLTREIFAVHFAKALICGSIHLENCSICENIEKHVHPDVYFMPENGDILKVDDAVKILDSVNFFGLEQDKKIYILDNFEFATTQMQNKILKVLEEPPENVYFLLMSGGDSGVLNPIKSRCKKLYINNLNDKVIDEILTDLKVLEDKRKIAKFVGENYLGRTLEAVMDRQYQIIFEACLDFLENCTSSKHVLKYSSRISSFKNNFDIFLKIYSLIISEICYNKCTNTFRTNIFNERFNRIGQCYCLESLIDIESKINFYNEESKRNCNISLIVDTMIFDNLQARVRK